MNAELNILTLFLASSGALFYTYVGYPLIVLLLAKILPKKVVCGDLNRTSPF